MTDKKNIEDFLKKYNNKTYYIDIFYVFKLM